MTVNVPCEVSVEVAVMLPPVRVLMVAVIADKSVAKNEDEVALTSVVDVAKNEVEVLFVDDAFTVERLVDERLVDERLVVVALVTFALVLYRVTAVSADDEAFPSVVLPLTVKAPDVVEEARSERKVVFSTQLTPSQ